MAYFDRISVMYVLRGYSMLGMSWQKFFMIVGILTVLYLVVRYVLPVVFSALGVMLTIAAYVVIIVFIIFAVIMGIGYISRLVRRQR